MKKELLVIPLIILPSLAFGGTDDTNELFGFTLGENFTDTSDKFRGFEKFIELPPSNPVSIIYERESNNKPFGTYSIEVNKKSNKLSSITGFAFYETREECAKEMKRQIKMIGEKKNITFRFTNFSKNLIYYSWDRENKQIKVQCLGDGDKGHVMLSARSSDKKIEKIHTQKVEGAFGFKFGDEFNLKTKNYQPINKNGFIEGVLFLRSHGAENIVEPFNIYRLTLNPDNLEIADITAAAELSDALECFALQQTYADRIKKKYNALSEQGEEEVEGEKQYTETIEVDDVSIHLSCTGKTFIIHYTDMGKYFDAVDAKAKRISSKTKESLL